MAVVPPVKNGLGFGSTEFHVFRPYHGIEARYIYYFVSSEGFRRRAERKMSGAVGQRRVPTAYVAEHEIPIPPSPEQERIVAKFDELFSELDKGIESLQTARTQLNVYRQAVLKHAFEGKLTAQWRDENQDKLETTEQLLARIGRERADRHEQQIKQWEQDGANGPRPRAPKPVRRMTPDELEGLPPRPNGWLWERLAWMTCGVEYGTAAKSAKTGRVAVLRMGNIQNTVFDWSDLVYTSDDAEIEKYSLKPGDVLFNRTNSPELVGKTASYRGEQPAIFAGYLIRVNHDPQVVDGQHLNLFLNSHVARTHGNSVKTDGVNQSNINGAKLVNYPFPYCSLEEQREIVRILDAKHTVINELETEIDRQLQRAVALRQSILARAFSGTLVPQDPSDEPASVLLERVRAEKAPAVVTRAGSKAKGRQTGTKKRTTAA